MKFSSCARLGYLFLALAAFSGTASAANISWQAPQAITGASDVSLNGTYVGSWAPYNASANQSPVNGVTFQGFDTLGVSQSGFDSGGNFFNTHTTADPNYNTLLGYAGFSFGTSAGFIINGNGGQPLAVGSVYEVQLWISDPRSLGGATRTATVSGSSPILYPADGTGMGQYLIGTFTADATTQEFIITANASAQLNLVQLRQVPEPSGALLGALSCGILLARRRRK